MIQQPFIYVFDADTAGLNGAPLTDGQDYKAVAVNLNSDAPFILRRISGLPGLSHDTDAKFRLFNQQGAYMQSGPFYALRKWDYPIIPELVYNPGAQIRFDIDDIGLGVNEYAAPGSTPNYYSQLGFQGVKVLQGAGYQTPYRYHERYYTYTQTLTIDYTGRLAPTYTNLANLRNYSVEMNDYDFELLYINMQVKLNGTTESAPSHRMFKLMLLDQYQSQLMSAPVLDAMLNWGAIVNNSVFPCPGVVYPVGSFIRYSLASLLVEADVPATLYISFVGKWRVNC